MIDFDTLRQRALDELPGSLAADPAAFSETPTRDAEIAVIETALNDNLRSLLSRALGEAIENVVADIEHDFKAKGLDADPAAVLAEHVAGTSGNFDDYDHFARWADRVTFVREAFSQAVRQLPHQTAPPEVLEKIFTTDPRLAGLDLGFAVGAPAPEPEAPADETPEWLQFLRALEDAGFARKDIAAMLEMSPAYVGHFLEGRRMSWPGMAPATAELVRSALTARNAALAVVDGLLDRADVIEKARK